jgi:peptidyl-dipeptidase Dcp
MLSDVTYPSLSGTSVFTDFVELPSQLYEHGWLAVEEIRGHAETGAPIPDDLSRASPPRAISIRVSRRSSLRPAHVDLDFTRKASAGFRRRRLRRIACGDFMPPEIVMRHRLPYFAYLLRRRIFGGYYSYLCRNARRRRFRGLQGDGRPFRARARPRDHIYAAGGGARTPMWPSAGGCRQELLLRQRGLRTGG